VLTSVAISTAYRPYWTRSTSATFKTFGSTIGSDAGINVLHEFAPGIRKMVRDHAPKFVSRIEERINNDQTSREVVSFRQDNVVAVRPFHTARGSGTGAMPV
jgi:hypothetical protein